MSCWSSKLDSVSVFPALPNCFRHSAAVPSYLYCIPAVTLLMVQRIRLYWPFTAGCKLKWQTNTAKIAATCSQKHGEIHSEIISTHSLLSAEPLKPHPFRCTEWCSLVYSKFINTQCVSHPSYTKISNGSPIIHLPYVNEQFPRYAMDTHTYTHTEIPCFKFIFRICSFVASWLIDSLLISWKGI